MVFEKVKAIIVEQLSVDEEKVLMSSNIQDDFDADSLDIVDLIGNFEEEFDLEIPDEQVEKIKTVEDVVKYIEATVGD
jgi:acyl carrier protein